MASHQQGHPLAGSIIIAAIFSVALAFYLSTPPPAALTGRQTALMAPLARAVRAEVATIVVPQPAPLRQPLRPAASPTLPSEPATVTAGTAEAPTPRSTMAEPLAAFSWSTVPSVYPMTVAPERVGAAPSDRGAVTHAFTTAGAAIRSAFRKTF